MEKNVTFQKSSDENVVIFYPRQSVFRTQYKFGYFFDGKVYSTLAYGGVIINITKKVAKPNTPMIDTLALNFHEPLTASSLQELVNKVAQYLKDVLKTTFIYSNE